MKPDGFVYDRVFGFAMCAIGIGFLARHGFQGWYGLLGIASVYSGILHAIRTEVRAAIRK